jgi:hypothetical protein
MFSASFFNSQNQPQAQQQTHQSNQNQNQNQNQPSVESDGLVEACKELEMFQRVIQHQPNLDPQTASLMFAHSLREKMKREGTLDKIANVQANPILQTAMNENYLQFTKSIMDIMQGVDSSKEEKKQG